MENLSSCRVNLAKLQSSFQVQLAVLTEFNKDMLGLVHGNLFKVLANEHFNRLGIPVFRNILAKKMRLKRGGDLKSLLH